MQDVAERDRYFNDRVFITEKTVKLPKEEFDFVFEIFVNSESLKSLIPNPAKSDLTISYIDSNLLYDIYCFVYDGDEYILKISFGDGSGLKKEFDILKSIEEQNIAPKALIYESIEEYFNIHILVNSFERGLNFFHLSQKNIYQSLPLVAENFKKLHTIKQESSEYDLFLNFYREIIDFDSNLSAETVQLLKADYLFVKCSSIASKLLAEAEEEIKLFHEDFLNKNSLCHTNVQYGTTLMSEGKLNFLNFHSSFFINPIFDIAFATLYLGLDDVSELELINNYLNENNEVSREEIEENLKKCKSICYKLIICKLLALSYYEKLTHKYDRINKHIRIYDIYYSVSKLLNQQYPYYTKYIEKSLKFFS